MAIFEGHPQISLQEFIGAWRAFWGEVTSKDQGHSDMSGVNVRLSSRDASIASSLGKEGALDSEMDAEEDNTDMAIED